MTGPDRRRPPELPGAALAGAFSGCFSIESRSGRSALPSSGPGRADSGQQKGVSQAEGL